MNIAEMHVWFRQYAQQMGLQNVRAILPEQIDLVINTSITDIVNQIVAQNIGITNDRIITDNSKISQINALRTLYKTFDSNFKSKTGEIWTENNATPTKYLSAKIIDLDKTTTNKDFDYLFLVDLSILYTLNSSDTSFTNYFPVRLIDDCYLADTLNDFILRPRLRSPIAVISNGIIKIFYKNNDDIMFADSLKPYALRIAYIDKPSKVAYLSDVGGTNVDCNLPEYLHVDILKHAVDLYRIAVSGQLHNTQQQAHQQQQVQAQQAQQQIQQ